MRRWANIAATGRYVPERCLSNRELETLLGEPLDDWLVANVGIRERHLMSEGESTSTMAAAAGAQALQRAGRSAEELDLVIVATDTPDQPSPATAAAVQYRLGARRAAAFDVNCACASWVTAVDIAAKAIAADTQYDTVLVIGAYGMSRFLDWSDKKTCTLFADGAGAVLLSAAHEPGVLGAVLAAAGEYHDALGVFTGGTARPATVERVSREGPPRVEFARRFPPTFNTERWPELIGRVLTPQRMRPTDVSLYLFTQLNLRTIEATMAQLGLPMTRTHWTMDSWGYTGSACIPMTLDHAVEQGLLARGDHVILCATGGGLALGCALLRWNP
jgi:3-oxoacyl-[acyl-carrier-protein] synthase-3